MRHLSENEILVIHGGDISVGINENLNVELSFSTKIKNFLFKCKFELSKIEADLQNNQQL